MIPGERLLPRSICYSVHASELGLSDWSFIYV